MCAKLIKKYSALFVEFYFQAMYLQTQNEIPIKKVWKSEIYSFLSDTYVSKKFNLKKKNYNIEKPIFLFENSKEIIEYEIISREEVTTVNYNFTDQTNKDIPILQIGIEKTSSDEDINIIRILIKLMLYNR